MIFYNGQFMLLDKETPTIEQARFVYMVKFLSENFRKGKSNDDS